MRMKTHLSSRNADKMSNTRLQLRLNNAPGIAIFIAVINISGAIFALYKSLNFNELGCAQIDKANYESNEQRKNVELICNAIYIQEIIAYALCLSGIVISVLLVIGVYKKNTGCILSWLVFNVITGIVFAIYCLLMIAFAQIPNPTVFLVGFVLITAAWRTVFKIYKIIKEYNEKSTQNPNEQLEELNVN